jgi:hypothetical protein
MLVAGGTSFDELPIDLQFTPVIFSRPAIVRKIYRFRPGTNTINSPVLMPVDILQNINQSRHKVQNIRHSRSVICVPPLIARQRQL